MLYGRLMLPYSTPIHLSLIHAEMLECGVVDMTETQFVVPRRRILSQNDLDLFTASRTYTDLIEFIESLNESVQGCPNSASCEDTPVIKSLLHILEVVETKVTAHPPVDNNLSRFGNPAFRDFYDDIQSSSEMFSEIPGLPESAIVEVGGYFVESFGNRTRIDYGSGHELNFLCFLLCLHKLKLIDTDKAVIIHVLWRYIEVMRTIQATYWLEPAGSHGVWGLDDYHFLPFLFGSAQLTTHPHLRPKSIHDADLLEMYGTEYMYLTCIININTVKTESLRWHSPMLDDISSAKSWAKINAGMVKMYKAEVLAKIPIMQHFMFGSLIPCPHGVSEASKVEGGVEHVHNTWADCCGIKVPSAIAARNATGGEKIRRMDWG